MASPNAGSYVNAMSHRALTLQERAAHVKGAVPPDRLNSAMLKRWQSQKPFQDTSVLDERLNAAGLSRIVFEAAISLDFPEDTKVVSADTDIVSAMESRGRSISIGRRCWPASSLTRPKMSKLFHL